MYEDDIVRVAGVSYTADRFAPPVHAPSDPGPGVGELRDIIRGFLDCPEIADCAPEDREPETEKLERRARAALATASTQNIGQQVSGDGQQVSAERERTGSEWAKLKAVKRGSMNVPVKDGWGAENERLIGWRVPTTYAGLSEGLSALERIEAELEAALATRPAASRGEDGEKVGAEKDWRLILPVFIDIMATIDSPDGVLCPWDDNDAWLATMRRARDAAYRLLLPNGLEAALSTVAAPEAGWRVPDGYAVVPIEPTDAMLRAAVEIIPTWSDGVTREKYAVMLKAAPPPPPQGEGATAPTAKERTE